MKFQYTNTNFSIIFAVVLYLFLWFFIIFFASRIKNLFYHACDKKKIRFFCFSLFDFHFQASFDFAPEVLTFLFLLLNKKTLSLNLQIHSQNRIINNERKHFLWKLHIGKFVFRTLFSFSPRFLTTKMKTKMKSAEWWNTKSPRSVVNSFRFSIKLQSSRIFLTSNVLWEY